MSDTPLTLGFDTSGAHCGAALIRGDACLGAAYENMAKGQAERLMVMLEEVLEEGGARWSDVERIGVGVGPGNFTGIRISVAAARGLALGLGVPTVGVSLLEALAFGQTKPTLACLDARRGAYFLQGFNGAPYEEPAFHKDLPTLPPGLLCIGTAGGDIAARTGGHHEPAVYAPASAIARIAARRAIRPDERPAPLYLRAPDATPSSTPIPSILP